MSVCPECGGSAGEGHDPCVCPKRLTNSEMATWRRCRRKWYLGTYRRLAKPEPDFGKPSGLGTRVHNALEKLYDPASGADFDAVQFIRDGISADLEQYPAYEDEILKEGQLAIIMMEGYLQWLEEEGHDQFLRLVSAEEGVEVPFADINGRRVNLLSKIDARVEEERDGSRWAIDHKTVANLTDPVKIAQINTQFLTEHLAEFLKLLNERGEDEAVKQRADGVIINMLRKVKRTATAKPPFYGREVVRHNVEELRNHWWHAWAQAAEILAAEQRLDAGESHHTVCYPNPTKDCSWDCPFYQICALHDDGSDVEGAIADLYVTQDPLARYSQTSVPKEDE